MNVYFYTKINRNHKFALQPLMINFKLSLFECVCVCLCVCLCAEKRCIFNVGFLGKSLTDKSCYIYRTCDYIVLYCHESQTTTSKLEKCHAMPVMPSDYDVFIIFLIYCRFGAQRKNIEGETFIKNNHVLAIRIFNQGVLKTEHSFQILYPTIRSNKSFKSLKVLLKFMN